VGWDSVVGIETCYRLGGLGINPSGARFEYWVFAGGKAAGAWHSSAEVKERV
jgi:hypothetical protein